MIYHPQIMICITQYHPQIHPFLHNL